MAPEGVVSNVVFTGIQKSTVGAAVLLKIFEM
jgi:hypothetical protein